MKVTEELLEDGKTPRGGWTKAQLALLGIAWPPEPGWRVRIMGNPITAEDARAFVELASVKQSKRPVKMKKARVNVDLNYSGPLLTKDTKAIIEERAAHLVKNYPGEHTMTCPAEVCQWPACMCM